MDIIARPQITDVDELQQLFWLSITDAFAQDGIDDSPAIKEEVEKQMRFVQQDFASQGQEVYFLLARTNEKIVGTIAYSKPNDLIQQNLPYDLKNVPEITSVYVLPEYQGQGVGSLLFQAMLQTLHRKKVEVFCLDGGYKKSQRFWMNKLGNPTVVLKNYWGHGLDHMIWYCKGVIW